MRQRWAVQSHQILTWVLLAGVVVQFYAAGLLVYGVDTLHRLLGWFLIPAAILWVAMGALGTGWNKEVKVALLLLVSLSAQPVIVFVLAQRSLYLAALHPVNGLISFSLVAYALAAGRRRGPHRAA